MHGSQEVHQQDDRFLRPHVWIQTPRQYSSPLENGDHPEVDDSKELDLDGIKKFQSSLIGSLQWVIQIGRFDVATAVMTMSSFRANPRVGHLK
jgi:hypothetical protein